jgi:isocitrate dehydrogenase (NAD+)
MSSEQVYAVTLIPGDGIGPEVMSATRRVLEAAGVRFDWQIEEAGAAVLEREGTPLPEHVIEAIRRTRLALKGPVTTPVGVGFRSVNVALRKALDLYAAVRPARSYPGTGSRFGHVDIVVVRENTEDVYAGIEFG